ncbi:MAG: hypothetical protein HON53_06565 [Planctomycetaceae bacterium]|jgi:class 3 adenylate cyclase|nr:hypothetical protein [Planctomycetaceae bacterium]MBT6156954.1 hypothetical protein [Planctomycetaceae bacterium]MBT6484477.1 hypothetical protein [Planctomycetaceae bacterium]MBT6498145.1 hypothetical protein [Planctomycetaceae bacterium]
MFPTGNTNSHEFTTLPASEQQGPDCAMQSLAVMFTDMAGSSRFAEKFGARAALQKRKRHNRLLLPLIEAHRGRLVEIVGDALMAVFEETADAARCATAMQQRLNEYNTSDDVDVDDLEIHIRIGIHTGKLVVYRSGDHFEVAGRAVNVAARVEAANSKKTDQILISADAQTELEHCSGFHTVPLANVRLKGIGRMGVFQLLWQDDHAEAQDDPPPPIGANRAQAVNVMATRPRVLSASSATIERVAPKAPATLRACHSLFLDVENRQGHVLPVWVRLQSGQPHCIHSQIDCDDAMRNSAVQAVHSAFARVRELGFVDAQLGNYAVEWWVGKQEIQYEGASLGLAVSLATVAALTGRQVDPRTAVTGAVDRGNVVAVTGVGSKWESLRSLGTFSRLIVAPGNLADLPSEAWREPELRISAVPTLEAAVAEVFGRIERPATTTASPATATR